MVGIPALKGRPILKRMPPQPHHAPSRITSPFSGRAAVPSGCGRGAGAGRSRLHQRRDSVSSSRFSSWAAGMRVGSMQFCKQSAWPGQRATVRYHHDHASPAIDTACCGCRADRVVPAPGGRRHGRRPPQLSSSTPLSGSALATMPERISLEFTEPVWPASVSLLLERDDGTLIPLAEPVIGADGHRVQAAK